MDSASKPRSIRSSADSDASSKARTASRCRRSIAMRSWRPRRTGRPTRRRGRGSRWQLRRPGTRRRNRAGRRRAPSRRESWAPAADRKRGRLPVRTSAPRWIGRCRFWAGTHWAGSGAAIVRCCRRKPAMEGSFPRERPARRRVERPSRRVPRRRQPLWNAALPLRPRAPPSRRALGRRGIPRSVGAPLLAEGQRPAATGFASIAAEGFGASAVSAGELELAERAGIAPGRVALEGIGKSQRELSAAAEAAAAWHAAAVDQPRIRRRGSRARGHGPQNGHTAGCAGTRQPAGAAGDAWQPRGGRARIEVRGARRASCPR